MATTDGNTSRRCSHFRFNRPNESQPGNAGLQHVNGTVARSNVSAQIAGIIIED